ncbi:VanZ family protein [Streptomyces sp. ST2-7A]|uniref:VanZ family protein n=1 Tax=Streptomyces sp. ST2-7A TaxID=2907214 RepID=UPI001F475483|nr:VanZ family protein [Streptomyces sp. ST2-7A]MCE7080354.1 VanZ family protein [Streptomyces sp. ST2-7A]
MNLYKDIFQGQGSSLISFLVVSALLCSAVGLLAFVALRGRAVRPLTHALHAAAITGVLRVTLFSDFGHQETGECVISKALLEGFTTQQGLANLVLFLPVGLLGTLATRRPTGMLLWTALLTTGVEITQAIVPTVARVCETGDLVMNVSGAWIGVLLATGWSAVRRRPLLGPPFGSRPVSVIAVVIAVTLTTVALTAIRPVVMDFTAGEREATKEQYAAMTEQFHRFLNGAVEIPGKEFVRYGGNREGGTVSVDLAEGVAGLDWPGGRRFDAAFPEGVPLPPEPTPITTAEQAEEAGLRYLDAHTVPPAEGSHIEVAPHAPDQWRVTRARVVDGVIMPARVELLLRSDGHLVHLTADTTPDPELPPVVMTETEAFTAARRHAGVPAPEESAATLSAEEVNGEWRPVWSIELITPDTRHLVRIDAAGAEPITVVERPHHAP